MHLLHSVGGSKVRGTCAGGMITISLLASGWGSGAGAGGGGLFVVVVVGRKRFDIASLGVARLESRIPSYNIKYIE